MVKPFFAMASPSCFKVAVFPGFSVTEASPFSRLTFTVSTPATDFNDTRTACAHTSQSIPKMVMLMVWISARPDTASNNKNRMLTNFFITLSSVRMLKQQIAEVHGKTHAFFGKERAHIAIYGGLDTKAHGVVVINADH